MHAVLANFGNLFGIDGIIILAIGLLIFGRRLPEVGRNLSVVARSLHARIHLDRDSIIIFAFLLYLAALLASYLAAHRGL